jgi:hypothetical protein
MNQMTFLEKILGAGRTIATALARFRDRTALIFPSKTAHARASLRLETRKRKELEAERLDRLRNPSDYQGR